MVGKASLQDAAHYPPFQLFLAALWMLQASSTNQESEHIFKCVPLQLVVCPLGKPASIQAGNKNNRKGRVCVCQQYQKCRNDSFAFSSFFLTSTASTNTGQLCREIRRSAAIAVVLSSFSVPADQQLEIVRYLCGDTYTCGKCQRHTLHSGRQMDSPMQASYMCVAGSHQLSIT